MSHTFQKVRNDDIYNGVERYQTIWSYDRLNGEVGYLVCSSINTADKPQTHWLPCDNADPSQTDIDFMSVLVVAGFNGTQASHNDLVASWTEGANIDLYQIELDATKAKHG